MTLTNVDEIRDTVESALKNGETLTIEYDSGLVTVSGSDLSDAWENFSLSEPFTVITSD